MPWETVNVSTSIHVETLISLAQVLFVCAQLSVQMTIAKVGTLSKYGAKPLTFEYLTDYPVFTRITGWGCYTITADCKKAGTSTNHVIFNVSWPESKK